jgi:hypothetical protein
MSAGAVAAAPVFSAGDAAYSGFRLIRDKPQTLLAWTGLQVAFIICWIAVNVLLLAPSAQRLRSLNDLMQADPASGLAQAPAVLGSLVPLLLIDIPLFLFFSGVQNAAILRAHLNPGEERWGYLRLGRAELNVALAPVVYWLLGFAYLFVVLFVANGIEGLGGAVAGSESALIGYGLVALLAVALIYPAVRLSLALPLTLAEGRIRILKSWRLTRGRFWPLLGAYALTTVYLVLVGLVALILFALLSWLISRALGGSGSDAWRTGEAPIVAQALTALISLPFDGLLLAATFAIWRGPSAEAYLAFKDDAAAAA